MKNIWQSFIKKIYLRWIRPLVLEDINQAVEAAKTRIYRYHNDAVYFKDARKLNYTNFDTPAINFVCLPSVKPIKKREIIKRLNYYLENPPVIIIEDIKHLPPIITRPTIYTSESQDIVNQTNFLQPTFNLDYHTNPNEGWEWHRLIKIYKNIDQVPIINSARQKFETFISQLKTRNLSKVYLFGTGPSLAKYQQHDFSDGYRIVCNSIVKDKETWETIKPDIIVAGDTIYHFGLSAYAQRFRQDLHKRLLNSPETKFIYPSIFHPFVMREFSDLEAQLIPIPNNDQGNSINTNLVSDFSVSPLDNILNLLLLPLGCTLSKNIYLWGFDGKSPKDKLFWSHSNKHNYQLLLPSVVKTHPAFFKYHIPKDNPNRYIETYMNDMLERLLSEIEAQGYHVYMMHPSSIKPLAKRYPTIPSNNI